MHSLTLLILATIYSTTASYGPFNYKAVFGSSPAPFVIDVDPIFIEQTKQKVALTRYPIEFEDVAPFEDGPPGQDSRNLQHHWVNEYNWTRIQAELNTKYAFFPANAYIRLCW